MNIRPIIIISGEPYGIFNEIFLKVKKKNFFKKPIILIGSKKILLKQNNKIKHNFKLNLLNIKDIRIDKLKKDKLTINLIDVDLSLKEKNKAIRNYIENGEKVIVVGGGSGASTVAVAHQVGNSGSIIAYEANKNSLARSKETIQLNKVNDRVEIKHAIIEKPVYLLGELGEPPLIPAKDFLECDVLVMDCEGAEIPILENMKIRPRLIIVEAHPALNSPKEEVIKLLEKLQYEIISSDSRRESLDVLSACRKN